MTFLSLFFTVVNWRGNERPNVAKSACILPRHGHTIPQATAAFKGRAKGPSKTTIDTKRPHIYSYNPKKHLKKTFDRQKASNLAVTHKYTTQLLLFRQKKSVVRKKISIYTIAMHNSKKVWEKKGVSYIYDNVCAFYFFLCSEINWRNKNYGKTQQRVKALSAVHAECPKTFFCQKKKKKKTTEIFSGLCSQIYKYGGHFERQVIHMYFLTIVSVCTGHAMEQHTQQWFGGWCWWWLGFCSVNVPPPPPSLLKKIQKKNVWHQYTYYTFCDPDETSTFISSQLSTHGVNISLWIMLIMDAILPQNVYISKHFVFENISEMIGFLSKAINKKFEANLFSFQENLEFQKSVEFCKSYALITKSHFSVHQSFIGISRS